MEAFAGAVGLGALSFGLGTVDVLNGQVELVFAVLAGVTVFGASISQHMQEHDIVGPKERHNQVVEQIGRNQGFIAIADALLRPSLSDEREVIHSLCRLVNRKDLLTIGR